jgi:hypothetical protein
VRVNDCASFKYASEVEKELDARYDISVLIHKMDFHAGNVESSFFGTSRSSPFLSFNLEVFVEPSHPLVPQELLIEYGAPTLYENHQKEKTKEGGNVIHFGICSSGELGQSAIQVLKLLCEICDGKKSPLPIPQIFQHLSLIVEMSRGVLLKHYLQALSSLDKKSTPPIQSLYPLPPPYDPLQSRYTRYKFRKRHFSLLVKLLSTFNLFPPSAENLLLPLPFLLKPFPKIMKAHDKRDISDYNLATEQEEGLFTFLSFFPVPAPVPPEVGSSTSSAIEVDESALYEDSS